MKRQSGVNLTEMLVVIAIVSLLMTIAIPGFQYITTNYRMSSEINGLLGDLMYAREEAIKQGQWVTICASTNGTSCSATTSWQTGWVIYSNPGNANDTPPANSILRVQAAFSGTTPDTFSASNGISAVSYSREGFATTTAGFTGTTITLTNPGQTAAYTRCLYVSGVGMAYAETPTNNTSGTCSQP